MDVQSKYRTAAPFVLVFCTACLAYSNTLFNELVFDDLRLISERDAIRDLWDFEALWAGRFWGEIWPHNILYRPLTLWTLALNYCANEVVGLPGPHTTSYHVVNILLHAGVSTLVFRFFLLLRVSVAGCLAGALLFAVHPVHTEAVAMIVGRSEMLAALFGLGALLIHRQRGSVAAAALCFLLALFSKESGIAFLALAVLWDLWPRVRVDRETLTRYTVYTLVTIGWLAARSVVVEGIIPPPTTLPLSEISALDRVLTAAHVQFKYLLLQVVPIGQSSDYSFEQVPVITSIYDSYVLLFLGVAGGGILLGRKGRATHPVILLALGGYAVAFAPASNFLLPIGTIMGERLTYSPSIFFCLLTGYGFGKLVTHRRRVGLGILGVALISCLSLTLARNATWANGLIFHDTQIASAPNSARANYGAGRAYHTTADLDRAIAFYTRALEIKPIYPDAWNNLGVARKDQGNIGLAREMYARAIYLEPKHARAHYNLGQALQQEGDLVAATDSYRTALGLVPDYPEACNNLAMILAQQGEVEEAVSLWEAALRIRPDYEIARINLGRLIEKLKR